MAQTLLAILVVLAAAHALPDLARLREFGWLRDLLMRWTRGEGDHGVALLVLPLGLFLLCVVVQVLLQGVLFGLPLFAFGVAVLFYSWGPRDLDADIEAVLKAPDSERRSAAAQMLRPEPALVPLPLESARLVEASFACALSRWFGVLFWFVVLGPAGALGYRIVQILARHPAFSAETGEAAHGLLDRAARVLDWAPAHLLALGLALVSEFDIVVKTWRGYHAAHGQGYFTLDLGFVGVLARVGIDADVMAGDGYASDVDNPLVELADARTVLKRILVSWLAVIAIVALAGWAG